ncbi:MAG: response regulator [Pseudomonadota bacterium]
MAVILIAHSDAASLRSCRPDLEGSGHVVLYAHTARAGLERLREGGIDVLVMDQEIAGGVEMLVAGLQKLPDPPPLLLLSSTVDAPLLSAHLGAAEFLPKPCTGSELSAAIARIVTVPPTKRDLEGETGSLPFQPNSRRS